MILPHPNAPLGSVLTLSSYTPGDFPPTAAILCRNTAPLVSFAFDLLRRSIPCHIVGKDIQIGLEKLIDSVGGASILDFRRRLGDYQQREVGKLLRKGKKAAAGNFEDKCQAVFALADRCDSISDVKRKVTSLFASGDGITLSTIHRSKGLEWSLVFLLDWNLLPSKYAEQEWELTQEKNLQYVAVTRAKLDLRFIESGRWK